jgi:RHS repeat-associated protein
MRLGFAALGALLRPRVRLGVDYQLTLIKSHRRSGISNPGWFKLMRLCRPMMLIVIAVLLSSDAVAQFPSVGLNGNESYDHTDLDSVDLGSGNVNLHIPLVGFPQKGQKLSLDFVVRYNQPLWSLYLDKVDTVQMSYTGHWLLGNTQYYAYQQDSLLSPIGVDVVRSQGITTTSTTQTYQCTSGGQVVSCSGVGTLGNPSVTTLLHYVRDRSGASHIIASESPQHGYQSLLAPDGSGWKQQDSNTYLDKNGVRYTKTGTYSGINAWAVSDAMGNQIAATSNGWQDSVGRQIPGTWGVSGLSGSGEDDPIPGVATDDLSHCSNATSARVWTVPGKSAPYYFCFQKTTGTTAFNVTTVGSYQAHFAETTHTVDLLNQIVLPNGKSYMFYYDARFFELTEIDLPQGGSMKYAWDSVQWTSGAMGSAKRVLVSRTVSDGNSASVWTYRWTPLTGGYVAGADVLVTNPTGNSVWHHHSADLRTEAIKWYAGVPVFPNGGSPNDTPTGTVLMSQDITHAYFPSPFYAGADSQGTIPYVGPPTSIITTMEDGSAKETDYTLVPASGPITYYNPNNPTEWSQSQPQTCMCLNYPQIQDAKNYDWGSNSHGPLLQETVTSYVSNQSYADANLIDLPSTVKVLDGAGTTYAETDISYDETEDVDGFTLSSGTVAGEATTMKRAVSATSWAVSNTAFSSQGQVIASIDGNGHAVSVSSFDCSGLFASTKLYAGLFSETDVHDCSTGNVTRHTDANGNVTTMDYVDPLGRLTKRSNPDGGSTITSYVDGPNASLTNTTAVSATVNSVVQFKLDGLSRNIGLVTSTPIGSIETETEYDTLGRLKFVSNPHLSNAGSIIGRSFDYDALGRPIRVTNPDASHSSTAYQGAIATVTNEAGNSWVYSYDALQRVQKVLEPTQDFAAYFYTPTNLLTQVVQQSSGTGDQRTRQFSYDAAGRLVSSTNPESGSICYGFTLTFGAAGHTPTTHCAPQYDGNGNLLAKTDARGQQTTYAYDALNRLTSRTRSDGSSDSYYYDGQVGTWGASPLVGANVIGRLSSTRSLNPDLAGASCQISGQRECDDEYYGYDAMGRMNHRSNSPPSEWGITYHNFDATYDLAGDMTGLSYPDGRQITQTFDLAGQLKSITDSNGTAYVSDISYLPSGTPSSISYGNGAVEYTSLNSRLQPCESKVTSAGSTVLDRLYFYGADNTIGQQCVDVAGNVGNIRNIGDGLGGSYNQNMGYDALNRLTSWVAPNMAGGYQSVYYHYDSFGNLVQNSSAASLDLRGYYGADNRLLSSQFNCTGLHGETGGYDSSGNILCSGSQSDNAMAYVWDPESRLSQLWKEQNNNTYNPTALYTYNAAGDRIRSDQLSGGQSQSFREYSPFLGQTYAEKDQNGSWTDYVFANGKRVARVDGSDRRIHMSGSNTSDGNARGSILYIYDVEAPVVAGDKLMWRQYQTGAAAGGLFVSFTDGTTTSWQLPDTDGQQVNSDSFMNQWHNRVVDLSPYVGKTLGWATPLNDVGSGDGQWDIYWADIALVRANGNVVSLYDGANLGPLSPVPFFESSMVHNLTAASEIGPALPGSPAGLGTHFYIADQVGTASLELGSNGYPVWKGEFRPFGAELDPGNTSNRFKFTGKERDAESGLDYMDARYYGSSMGRFMSPDPLGGHLEDPQTLNRYAYARNNPLSFSDPTGLDFAITCTQTKDNASTCQSQTVGYDKKGNAQTAFVQGVTGKDGFKMTQVGDDGNGGLVDRTTGTGAYTASVSGSGVSFSQDGGKSSSGGVFVNGTDPTHIQGSGDLSGFGFTFTNSKLEGGQTAAGTFSYSGTLDQARSSLVNAGFAYWPGGTNFGYDEFRSRGQGATGANAGHFNLDRDLWGYITGHPKSTVPQGNMHFGEHNPMFSPLTHAHEAAQ